VRSTKIQRTSSCLRGADGEHLGDDGICDPETVNSAIKGTFSRRLAVLGSLENVGTNLTLAIQKQSTTAHDYRHIWKNWWPRASLASNPAKASASGRRRTGLAADEVDVTLKARSYV